MGLRVGIVGLGVMGRAHLAGYARAGAKIVGVSDRAGLGGGAGGNLTGIEPGWAAALQGVEVYSEASGLLSRGDLDLVSVCTPTDSHVDLALAAIEGGADVLVEKPVATTSEEIDRLRHAATASGRLIIPAMVMRFWPGWDWLKGRVDDASAGRLVSLTLTRVGSPPGWSREFYGDASRTGGALFDLHVHDADFVVHLLGRPRAVFATGERDHLTGVFLFDDASLRVVAEGGWVRTPGFPFRMRYTAEFERGVADWDLSRSPGLLWTEGGTTAEVPLPGVSAYDVQVLRAMERVGAWRAGRPTHPGPTLEEALAITGILEAMARALSTGRIQEVP